MNIVNSNIKIGSNSTVSKDCVLLGKVIIGSNCNIISSTIEDCIIKDNVVIKNSTIEKSVIKNNATIGPYSHIRPNCVIGENVHIGNFVEIKNSNIGKRTKIPHLTYVGDADVGEDVNIGCGVIFCNYDGKEKYRSTVGNRVFIGSNSNIISPVVIENDSFIAAGSTITKDVMQGELALSRTSQENKTLTNNPYIFNFESEPKLFGTDGIRGIYGQNLTKELCYCVGFAIGKLKSNSKVLIARDTRPSGKEILEILSLGLSQNNAQTFDAGIVSTPGLSYLVKHNSFDYGIMITASHNPSEYNGIKIFNKNGYKINKNVEKTIEKIIEKEQNNINKKCEKNTEKTLQQQNKNTVSKVKEFSTKQYMDFLTKFANINLENIKIFIDCANGAVSGYVKQIFKQTKAKIFIKNCDGEINKNASVLDKSIFQKKFEKSNCDIGFCFDGDADRVMMSTKEFGIFDGDKILYLLARHFNEKFVVGTIMTNLGIEKALNRSHIKMFRVNVGDRNIAKLLKQKSYNIGAEASGHVIIHSQHVTGDGVLTALNLLSIYKTNKKLFEQTSKIKILPMFQDKIKNTNKDILKSKNVKNFLEKTSKELGKNGRLVLRPSGTEPVIRIMVESTNESLVKQTCQNVKNFIMKQIAN